MSNIKKNDTAFVIKGKDKGKKGRVLNIFTKDNKALVEGINLAKKHKRPTRQDQKGGIVSIEMPIALANLKLVCKNCNQPVRVSVKRASDGTKERICKKCNGSI